MDKIKGLIVTEFVSRHVQVPIQSIVQERKKQWERNKDKERKFMGILLTHKVLSSNTDNH
jgi:hypothetical protein